MATRLQQMKAAAEAWQRGAVNDRTKEQWGRMQKAFSKPSSLMHKLLNGQDKQEEGGWKKIIEDVKELGIDQDHSCMGGHVEWVKAQLERIKRRDVEEAGKAWRRWVEEQRKKGMGAVHAYVNRKEEIMEIVLPGVRGVGSHRHKTLWMRTRRSGKRCGTPGVRRPRMCGGTRPWG